MSKQKTHTPGPLHAIEYQDGLWMVGNDADGERLSTAHGIKNKADAVLYAAAGKMLAALEALEKHCRVENPECRGNPAKHREEGLLIRKQVQEAIAIANQT